ncbi:uncharacterized protein PHALS_08479 [Plasmopara halstedii]|uniref:Uncharacterized protein n=1 Tax=Plasmopara halstedii TaxID=4781 RepID=A0A0P1ABZ4_PLAHL|nr:uncharacterized protein PHALS_08479 [Plasmopara halstedii]CEG38401.1 hypothetical protein PHALS_08479 [Plasmopara halstedii]|eukprot:XP_024574770.1 hypothetical protein PHALS_08479 [Plasmopara halstedii]
MTTFCRTGIPSKALMHEAKAAQEYVLNCCVRTRNLLRNCARFNLYECTKSTTYCGVVSDSFSVKVHNELELLRSTRRPSFKSTVLAVEEHGISDYLLPIQIDTFNNVIPTVDPQGSTNMQSKGKKMSPRASASRAATQLRRMNLYFQNNGTAESTLPPMQSDRALQELGNQSFMNIYKELQEGVGPKCAIDIG